MPGENCSDKREKATHSYCSLSVKLPVHDQLCFFITMLSWFPPDKEEETLRCLIFLTSPEDVQSLLKKTKKQNQHQIITLATLNTGLNSYTHVLYKEFLKIR